MKLGNVREEQVYCLRGFDVGTWAPGRGFRSEGRVPNPYGGVESVKYAFLHRSETKAVVRPLVGYVSTGNVFAIDADHVLVNIGRWVLASSDGGESWERVHELPRSSSLQGVLPTGFCESDGAVFLAEYAFGDVPGRILTSTDHGRTWSTVLERGDIRHFHGVFEDPYSGALWATTGDRDEESAIGRVVDGEFVPVGRGSQEWRAVDLTFTPDSVIWGMDCSYAVENRIFRLPRDRLGDDSPTPDVIGTTDNSVFFAETLPLRDDTWIVVSTSSEPGVDSTAPPGRRRNTSSTRVRVLAAPLEGGEMEWSELHSFRRTTTAGVYLDRVPRASSHAFLGSSRELGLIINPYNVSEHNGRILRVAPDQFRRERILTG